MHTLSALVAGTSFATDLLHVVFKRPCDHLCRRWRVTLALMVDDLSIQAVGNRVPGREDGTLTVSREAVAYAVSTLEEIGCRVSLGGKWQTGGKTVAVCNCVATAKRAALSFQAMGIQLQRSARHLGIDFAPGRARSSTSAVAKERMKLAGETVRRIHKLGIKGLAAIRIARSGLVPSASYGTEVRRVTDEEQRKLTCLVRQAPGKHVGRSAYARTYLTGGGWSAVGRP